MRVLFVAHSYPRHGDDVAGSFLLRLAVALREHARVDVRVLAPAAAGLPPDDVFEGIPVRRFRYAPRAWETLAYTGTMAEAVKGSWASRAALGGMLASASAAIRREAGAVGAHLVHAHWWFPSGLAALVPGTLGGRPLVTTLHGSDVRLAQGIAPARALYARVARRSAAVTAVSRWLCERATDMAPGSGCAIAPMPVPVEHFTAAGAPNGSDARVTRGAIPAPPPETQPREGVLFVGRLTAQKGVDVLLRAVARLRTPATLTVVGAGPEEGGLRAEAEALGIGDRVRWIGARPQRELATFYRAARVVAIPSREEGLGLVAVEAHLCGAPVVAFDSGGLPDVVRHERDGLLVPPGDEGALAHALDALLADPGRADALGAAGRDDALATFSPAAVAARYRAIYERALARAGRAVPA